MLGKKLFLPTSFIIYEGVKLLNIILSPLFFRQIITSEAQKSPKSD